MEIYDRVADLKTQEILGSISKTTKKPQIGIITVNYFSSEEVATMLASWANLETGCDLHICVVDNSCDDREWERLQQLIAPRKRSFESLIAHRSDSNNGFSAGNNAGYRRIASFELDIVVIVNPDVVLIRADFDEAARTVLSRPNTIFGAQTLSGPSALSGLACIALLTGRSRELSPEEEANRLELVYPSGHFIAISNDLWQLSGGLSEDYFLFGEEADLVLTLQRAVQGFRVESLTSVVVAHTGGLTSGASKTLKAKSHLTYEEATRSSMILFRKHRRLRRWLPFVVFARLAYAAKVRVVVGATAARAVLAGLIGGLFWRGRDVG